MKSAEGIVRVLFVLVVAGGSLVIGGCGEGSESGGAADTGPDVITDLPVSESCESACDTFMEECGSLTTASRVECELGCARNWSESVATCVAEASNCGQIESCGNEAGGDAGPSPDVAGGDPADADPQGDAGDEERDGG